MIEQSKRRQGFLRPRAQEERYVFQCYEKGKCIQMLLNSVWEIEGVSFYLIAFLFSVTWEAKSFNDYDVRWMMGLEV